MYNTNGTYNSRWNIGHSGSRWTPNAVDPATGLPALGNVAETFEFRAIDRDLRTPYVQQWNFGIQYEFAKDLLFEARYLGTKGTKLLQATAFNQGYDLNDSSTPDAIFERFNAAYVSCRESEWPAESRSHRQGAGVGKAFGFPNSTLNGKTGLQPVQCRRSMSLASKLVARSRV